MKNCTDSNDLCLECGLCCNGVIFADVQLQPGGEARRLEALGLRLAAGRGTGAALRKLAQPCCAWDGGRCAIYADRPQYCRQFECLLLQQVKSGRMEKSPALRLIRLARRRSEQVRSLLRQLGDADEQLALPVRFRRVKNRVERAALDAQSADLFSRLTLAVQDLNVLLSGSFYPAAG